MKTQKSILMFFFFILAFSASVVRAQEIKSDQTLFSLNDKSAPFRENETTIAEVTFNGLDSDGDSCIKGVNCTLLFEREFRESLFISTLRMPFFPEWKFNLEKVKKLTKIFQEKIETEGYLEAKTSVTGEKLPDNQMRLIVSIERGDVARVSEIRFIGNKSIASEELIEAFKNRNDYWQVFLKWHYKHYLEDSAQKLMFSKGFLQAKIKGVLPQKTSNGYVVTIEVEEGVRYRIGNIKIEGTKIFSEKEILEMLNQNDGEIADGRNLKNFFDEKLKRIYADKGHIQYASTIETDFVKPLAKGLDGTVNIRATINEGRISKISKIDFWEIEESKAAELRRISGLKINDIYSQSALETALKNIDDTKEFEPTNLGFSVQLQVDEDTGDLEIEFDLSRKE